MTTISRRTLRSLAAKDLVRSHDRVCGKRDGQSGNGTSVSLSTMVLPHSTNAPTIHSPIHFFYRRYMNSVMQSVFKYHFKNKKLQECYKEQHICNAHHLDVLHFVLDSFNWRRCCRCNC